MTTLSWMFYAAMVATKVGHFFIGVLLLGGLFLPCRIVYLSIMREDESKDHWSWQSSLVPTWFIVGVSTALLVVLITMFVPDYNTILTIAAVEMGNDVLYSEEFQKLLDTYLPKE